MILSFVRIDEPSIPAQYKKHISLAKSLAFSTNCKSYKVSSIIIRGGNIIAAGHNNIDCVAYTKMGISEVRTTHAEVAAICNAARTGSCVEGAKILVYRFMRKNGHLANSKPCSKCHDVLLRSGIKSAMYVMDGKIKSYSVTTGSERILWQ